MTVYFKRGAGSHIYLLWMGELQKKGNSDSETMQGFFKTQSVRKIGNVYQSEYRLDPIKVPKSDQKISDVVTRFDSKSNIMRMHKIDSICYMCLASRSSSHFVSVRNTFIFELYDKFRNFYRLKILHTPESLKEKSVPIEDSEDPNPFDQERDSIPNYFRNTMAYVNVRSFQEQRENKAFQEEKSLICIECYLKGTKKMEKHIEEIMKQSGAQHQSDPEKKIPQKDSIVFKNKYFISTRASNKIRIRRLYGVQPNEMQVAGNMTSVPSSSRDDTKLRRLIRSKIASNTEGAGTSTQFISSASQTKATWQSSRDTDISNRMEKVYGLSKNLLKLPARFALYSKEN